MAYLEREDGSREELFGSGGGESLAAEVEAPLLGRIPFDPRLGALADEGEPIVLAEPDAVVSRAIVELAEAIAATRREQGVGIEAAAAGRELSVEGVRTACGRLGTASAARILAEHFLDADTRARRTHVADRVASDARGPGSRGRAEPRRRGGGLRAVEGRGAPGYLTLAAVVDAQLEAPPGRARVVVARECFPPVSSATGCAGSRKVALSPP